MTEMEMELDRLSSLPGHVMDRILSHLPIRDAVRTSILSRNWRYKWSAIPHLVFDSQCVSLSSLDETLIRCKIVNIIDHVLLLHDGAIDQFRLSHKDFSGSTDIDRWVLHLSRKVIKELILEVWKGKRYRVPSCLFTCQNLVRLELYNCDLKPPPFFKGFRNVKILDIQHVTIAQDAFENLISSCPLLERLSLINFDGFISLNIDSPSLQFLDVGGSFVDVNFKNTLHLDVVSIGLYETTASEARWNSGNLCNFFENLPHVRRLEVQSYFFKFLAFGTLPGRLPKHNIHLNYLSLSINFSELDEVLASLCIFRSSPNLNELAILARTTEQSVGSMYSNFWEDDQWSSTFSNLRLVRILSISGVKSEMNFIRFLLRAAPLLEKMIVEPASNCEGSKLMKKLLRYRRTSVLAEIFYSG